MFKQVKTTACMNFLNAFALKTCRAENKPPALKRLRGSMLKNLEIIQTHRVAMGMKSEDEWIIEFMVFEKLCKRYRRDDVVQVYTGIQSAIAFKAKRILMSQVLGKILPISSQGLGSIDPGIGMSGLAFFNWIYEVELIQEGSTNYHEYLFRRRHDNAELTVDLKTTNDPNSHHSAEDYREQLTKLERSRDDIFVKYRFGTNFELWFGR